LGGLVDVGELLKVLVPFEGGIANGRQLPVAPMVETGHPLPWTIVSFMDAMTDGYLFDSARGVYVLDSPLT
jgi:hypothetical protein